MNLNEIIGYAGSLLVAVSLSMQSVLRLRWINLVGAAIFALYGWLIGAMPILVVNGYIAVMDAYYLWQIYRQSDFFTLEPLSEIGDLFFLRFMRFHEKDIVSYFPRAFQDTFEPEDTWLLFRNMMPVGVFAIRPGRDGTAEILMDYVIPAYRDFQFGRFLFEHKRTYFRDRAIRTLEAWTAVPAHQGYLENLGFTAAGEEAARGRRYIKAL
ncbi:MAG TPA: hypothetical protein PLP29_01395 [Candidatus Ozemobacteraceae bacterium]|nr:hypothetical protein [Candidatus Ozemobacteraceae bacterium]